MGIMKKTLLFVGANKDETGIYRDVFGTSQYDKEGNLGEESVVYDFQNHVSNGDPTSPLNQ
jgi:hypothetical protein